MWVDFVHTGKHTTSCEPQLHSVSLWRLGAVDFSSGLVTVCEGRLHKEFQVCTTAGMSTETNAFRSLFLLCCPSQGCYVKYS